jgi:hypothetical protein
MSGDSLDALPVSPKWTLVDPGSERVEFEGRFEECRNILVPAWPFLTQGDLDLTISVRMTFQPPIAVDDDNLTSYRRAMMHANQGTMEVHAVPVRGTR